MDCPTEEKIIRNKLEAMPGIEELRFNLIKRELTVLHRLKDEQPLEAALIALDMQPERKGKDCESCGEHPIAAANARTKLLVGISGAAATIAEIGIRMGTDEKSLLVIAPSVLAILTGGAQTAKKGWIGIKTFTLNINFLMMAAVIGAVAIGKRRRANTILKAATGGVRLWAPSAGRASGSPRPPKGARDRRRTEAAACSR